MLKNDQNYYDADLSTSYLTSLSEFCLFYCKSAPDLEIQYNQVSLDIEEGQSLPKSLLERPSKPAINIRLTIKSDNAAVTIGGNSVAEAKNLAALQVLKKNFIKEYFEFLEYQNSEQPYDLPGTRTFPPGQYENTLVEFCDWSGIGHPSYFQLENYPGLLKSQLQIFGKGENKNIAALNALAKAQEMFATNGQNGEQHAHMEMEMADPNDLVGGGEMDRVATRR